MSDDDLARLRENFADLVDPGSRDPAAGRPASRRLVLPAPLCHAFACLHIGAFPRISS
jgi:hypothetical protein